MRRVFRRTCRARSASLVHLSINPQPPLPIMKTNKSPLLALAGIAVLSGTVLLSACSRDSNTADTPADTASATESEMKSTMNAATTAMSDTWDDLKDYSYEQRSEFAAKANNYAEQLDRRIQTAGNEASDELAEARDELRAAANDVSNATADTWDSTKQRVARAWTRAQTAYQAAE